MKKIICDLCGEEAKITKTVGNKVYDLCVECNTIHSKITKMINNNMIVAKAVRMTKTIGDLLMFKELFNETPLLDEYEKQIGDRLCGILNITNLKEIR